MARVPYLSREDLPEEKRAIYDQMVSERGRVTRPMQALLNSPDLAGKVAETGFHVRFHSSTLPPEVPVNPDTAPQANARTMPNASTAGSIRRPSRETVLAISRPSGTHQM